MYLLKAEISMKSSKKPRIETKMAVATIGLKFENSTKSKLSKAFSNFNDFSIGIELEGMVSDQYTDAQYRELSLLIDKLKDLYPSIKDDNILGHSDIAPDRKGDPGKNFKWEKIK